MPDLYKILKIRRNAAPEAVKKAYRAQAMKYHPDRNPGDAAAEQFKQVNLAYRVLSDPARRERYDRTGEYGEGGADNSAGPVYGFLAHCFAAVLGEVLARGLKPECEDLVGRMRTATESLAKDRKARQTTLEKELETHKKLSGRFAVAGEGNFLEALVQSRIGERERGLAAVREELSTLEQAVIILQKATFQKDARPEDKPSLPGMWAGNSVKVFWSAP